MEEKNMNTSEHEGLRTEISSSRKMEKKSPGKGNKLTGS
jgi:hypothetical protein